MFTLCEKILEIIMIWNWKEGEVIKWGLTLIPYWRRGGRRVITLFFIFKGLDAFQKWIYPLPENHYFLPGGIWYELFNFGVIDNWRPVWLKTLKYWKMLLDFVVGGFWLDHNSPWIDTFVMNCRLHQNVFRPGFTFQSDL